MTEPTQRDQPTPQLTQQDAARRIAERFLTDDPRETGEIADAMQSRIRARQNCERAARNRRH